MPTIISEGHLPTAQVYNGTCPNCKTIFTFTRNEAELVHDRVNGDYLQLECPLPGCYHQVATPLASPNFGR